ncbi:hypothetical protein FACS189413_13950 [Bacteroidia bacterium]|nr:hypothetical protein FACS189413_13950 [Bacteroidia bacterium]
MDKGLNRSNWFDCNVSKIKYGKLNILSGALRIAITSKCNMACVYCHREGCISDNTLSREQIIGIVERSMNYGVRSVRLTGGEPTIHPEITDICREIKTRFPNISFEINSNIIEIETILNLISHGWLDSVAVGLDFYDRKVSKDSPTGIPSAKVLNSVLRINETGCNVSITNVYNGDLDNITKLAYWCRDNKIFLRILEKIDDVIADEPTGEYIIMAKHIIKELGLTMNYQRTKDRYYGTFPGGERNKGIYFFISHCRLRECELCKTRYFKVSNEGKTQSCLFPNTPQFSLLDFENFDINFRKALCYHCIPPERNTEVIE